MCVAFVPSLSWKIVSQTIVGQGVCVYSMYIFDEEMSIYLWRKEITWKNRVIQGHFERRRRWCREQVCWLFSIRPTGSALHPCHPTLCPGAHLDEQHGSSAMLSTSCCVQPVEALAGAWGTWRAGEGEVGTPISFPTRMQVGCFVLKRVPAPIRQASFNIYGFSNFLRASGTAFFPYPFRTRRGS